MSKKPPEGFLPSVTTLIESTYLTTRGEKPGIINCYNVTFNDEPIGDWRITVERVETRQ